MYSLVTVLALLLKYADGLDSFHKRNIDKYDQYGKQHDSSIGKFNNSCLPSRPFMLVHSSAIPKFFFYVTCFSKD